MDVETASRLVKSRMDDVLNIKFAADFLLEATAVLRSMFDERAWNQALDDVKARSLAANDRVRERRGLPPIA
ncbi:MAG: hypothetical protein ACXWD3_17040 [Mycobacterium sp.]